ncbi:MAG: SLC13 family permease [Gammaproteobacteria bacterium]|nr:SLC13 family permease [Gammaproteobacteria bacterium]
MFEFTAARRRRHSSSGSAYLLTVGRRLAPGAHPARATTSPRSSRWASTSPRSSSARTRRWSARPSARRSTRPTFDVDVAPARPRTASAFIEPLGPKVDPAPATCFAVRTDRETLVDLLDAEGSTSSPARRDRRRGTRAPPRSATRTSSRWSSRPARALVGETLAIVVVPPALRRERPRVPPRRRTRPRADGRRPLRVGDTLLVQGAADSHRAPRRQPRLHRRPRARAARLPHVEDPGRRRHRRRRRRRSPRSTSLPIVVAALAGVARDGRSPAVLKPTELYDAVDWNVIFLLAGVIPLGIALEQTGGADLLGRRRRRDRPTSCPPIGVLWAVLRRHGAPDERHLEQRERRADDPGRRRGRPRARRERRSRSSSR